MFIFRMQIESIVVSLGNFKDADDKQCSAYHLCENGVVHAIILMLAYSFLSFFLISVIDLRRIFHKNTNQTFLVGLKRVVPILFFFVLSLSISFFIFTYGIWPIAKLVRVSLGSCLPWMYTFFMELPWMYALICALEKKGSLKDL